MITTILEKIVHSPYFIWEINIGAALGGLLCGYVGQKINWHYGFGIAGIFMVVGLVVFILGKAGLKEKGLPLTNDLKKKIGGLITVEYTIYALTFLALPLIVTLFNYYEAIDSIMLVLAVVSVVYILYVASKLEYSAKLKLLSALTLVVVSTFFWAFYEQNAGSLNLFAMRNVDMHVFGVELPALSVNNFLPPAWVIIMSLVFATLWPWLNKLGLEPSTAAKFALSFIFVAIGFFTFYLACKASLSHGLIPLLAFVGGYFFIFCGEMCISPVGLSMITKLSPTNIVGLMMGIFFFFTAIGEFLAGKIGALMSIPKAVVEANNPALSLPYYADVLLQISIYSAGIGVFIFLLVPMLKKWMGDIR